ncbi:hypothetical protein [Leptodesmis sichuanensis]|uniref:hypothetical protein n=1 Tax=Leptodesmis sichuanensis TaxID=2906798 RepID=UPI001F401547|nr:hypothetical protein [Leptodesmis sichuanensis]UIE36014.1 hypothetical protein KIK02_13030 [Leptodesmis sichuanensis A121]
MKLVELKAKVYELSGVDTTQQLKAKYKDLKTLDMRRKDAWMKALSILQDQQKEFNHWLENPPEEYQQLFAEIEDVSRLYDQKRTEFKQVGAEVRAIVSDLEELAGECQDEATTLRQEVKTARQIKKKIQLN